MKNSNFIKKTYKEVKNFTDIVDGNEYLINYNGVEFKSLIRKDGDYLSCADEEHGMRIKFKEQNMDLGHIYLKEIKNRG